jgi:hypothetical protein
MLVHSVRRVPPPKASSSHRISKPPQLYSTLGASARVTVVSETCGVGASTVVTSPWFQPYSGSHRVQKEPTRADALGRKAPASLLRRVAQLSDEDERPLSYLRPAGRTLAIRAACPSLSDVIQRAPTFPEIYVDPLKSTAQQDPTGGIES